MNSRETNNLEYKVDITNSFLKTITAFANYGDGKIIFGINDDGNIIGLDNLVDKALSIENKINDNIRPIPDYSINIDKEKKIIILNINKGLHKPYYYKNKAYKRADSATIEIDRIELNRLILESGNKNYEELSSDNQNLQFDYLEKALKENLNISSLNLDILKTLSLYSDKTGFNKIAEILSDKNNIKIIDIVKFGETIDIFLDRKTMDNISLIKAFNDTLDFFRDNYTYEIIKGSSRKRIEKIPEKAFREALANAVIHRTWDINAYINISMYDDRIEITSPGSLPTGISKEEYLQGQISILRNPILAGVFFRLKYIEQFGTGIKRINLAYENSLIKPEYNIYKNTITVVLPVYNDSLNILNEDEKIIYNILSKNLSISRAEIENLSGFSKGKTIRLLNNLIDENIIEKIGKSVETKYKLL